MDIDFTANTSFSGEFPKNSNCNLAWYIFGSFEGFYSCCGPTCDTHHQIWNKLPKKAVLRRGKHTLEIKVGPPSCGKKSKWLGYLFENAPLNRDFDVPVYSIPSDPTKSEKLPGSLWKCRLTKDFGCEFIATEETPKPKKATN